MQIMTSITTTLEMFHWEWQNMLKQELYMIMVAVHSLAKGYGMMIYQIISTNRHLFKKNAIHKYMMTTPQFENYF